MDSEPRWPVAGRMLSPLCRLLCGLQPRVASGFMAVKAGRGVCVCVCVLTLTCVFNEYSAHAAAADKSGPVSPGASGHAG